MGPASLWLTQGFLRKAAYTSREGLIVARPPAKCRIGASGVAGHLTARYGRVVPCLRRIWMQDESDP